MGEANRHKKLVTITSEELHKAEDNFKDYLFAHGWNKELLDVQISLYQVKQLWLGHHYPRSHLNILSRNAEMIRMLCSPYYVTLIKAYLARKLDDYHP